MKALIGGQLYETVDTDGLCDGCVFESGNKCSIANHNVTAEVDDYCVDHNVIWVKSQPEPITHDKNKFKVGDLVIIDHSPDESLHHCPATKEWSNAWIALMDDYVGTKCRILSATDKGYSLERIVDCSTVNYAWPSCVLKLIESTVVQDVSATPTKIKEMYINILSGKVSLYDFEQYIKEGK